MAEKYRKVHIHIHVHVYDVLYVVKLEHQLEKSGKNTKSGPIRKLLDLAYKYLQTEAIDKAHEIIDQLLGYLP